MSDVLQRDEPEMQSVRRIFVAQLDKAIRAFEQHTLADDAVHRIRKELKRVRATLRLLRSVIGEAAYARDNKILRNAAHLLTPIRGAKVLLETLDGLLRSVDAQESIEVADDLRRALRFERSRARRQLSAHEMATSGAALRGLKQRVQRVPDARFARTDLGASLTRTYKKARKAFALARREPSNEHLHEWRKQVKYSLSQLEVAQPLKLKRIGKSVKKARKLADHLGNDHDLVNLHEKITMYAARKSPAANGTFIEALISQLKCKRAKLRRKSFRLGPVLYSDKPRRVEKRLARYVQRWRQRRASNANGTVRRRVAM